MDDVIISHLNVVIRLLPLTEPSRLLTRKLVVRFSVYPLDSTLSTKRFPACREDCGRFMTRLQKSISWTSLDIPQLLHISLTGYCSKGLPGLEPCVLSFDR